MQHSAHVDDRLGIPALISPIRRRRQAHCTVCHWRAAEHGRFRPGQVGFKWTRHGHSDTATAQALQACLIAMHDGSSSAILPLADPRLQP